MIKNINDLSLNTHLIDPVICVDVMKRIIDWVASGGSFEDDYVLRQLSYANNFIKEEVN